MSNWKFIGALTSKPYAFTSRPWEINNTNSIDILDILGSNIRIDSYGSQIKRILPLKNDEVNREYISNRVRFFFDGLNRWRLITPILKNNNDFLFSSWDLVFPYMYLKFFILKKSLKNLGFFFNNFTDINTLLFTKLVSDKNGYYLMNKNKPKLSNFYNFYINQNLLQNLKEKEIIIFVGTNLRLESPILNIHLRTKNLNSNTVFLNFGSKRWDNLNSLNLGNSTYDLISFFKGKHKFCTNFLKKFVKNSLIYKNWLDLSYILVGSDVLNRTDSQGLFNIINYFYNNIKLNNQNIHFTKSFITKTNNKLKERLLPFNLNKTLINNNYVSVIYPSLNNLLFNDINIFSNTSSSEHLDVCYYLGHNNIQKQTNKLIIFQGHHTNYENLKFIDILLPTLNFLEKRVSYINLEGRVQDTNIAVQNLSNSKSDWVILNTFFIYLSEMLLINHNILKNSKLELNRYKDFLYSFQYVKRFLLRKNSINLFWKELSKYSLYNYNVNSILSLDSEVKTVSIIYYSIFSNYFISPYNLDIISSNSKWMINAENLFKKNYTNFLKF